MKKKKKLVALVALMMSFVSCTVNAGESSDNTSKIKDCVDDLSNLSESQDEMNKNDINCDNTVNTLDSIYSKSTVSGDVENDAEIKSVQYLNTAASHLFEAAKNAALDIETNGEVLSNRIFSSDDMKKIESFSEADREILEEINVNAEFLHINKWAVLVEDWCVLACVTGDEIIQRTGACPNIVPQQYNIPFSNDLVEKASKNAYDWKEDFNEFLSTDPVQSSLPEYPLSFTLEMRNKIAKSLFGYLQIIAQEFEDNGMLVDGIISSDDADAFTEEIQKYYSGVYGYYNHDGAADNGILKWTADIRANVVYGVVFGDEKYNICDAYPTCIPYTMNIPYSPDLIEYSCNDTDKDWQTDFSEYITDDEEQLALAEEYSKISVSELNDYAKAIFTSSVICQIEYETNGMGSNVEELISTQEFIDDVKSCLPFGVIRQNIKWDYFADKGEIKGIIVTDGNKTGAYPNSVPFSMSIPYSTDLLKYSYGPENLWEEDFKEYDDSTADIELLPYIAKQIQKASINSCNSNAKMVRTLAGEALDICSIDGDDAKDGIITSEDDSKISKYIFDSITIPHKNTKWAIYVSGGAVKGAVWSDGKYTGAYPKMVPTDCVVTYDSELACKVADKDFKWFKLES